MRKLNAGWRIVALALILTSGLAHAADKNPSAMYDSWAKLKIGSSVTTRMTTDARGQTVEMDMTYTLTDVQPEKVTLDVKQTMIAAGRTIDMPGHKMDVLKSGAPAGGPVGPSARGPRPPDTDVKESEETVKIGDKEYKCHVFEGTTTVNGGKATSKTWMCPDVPNLIVKMEMSADGANPAKSSTVVTKIELK